MGRALLVFRLSRAVAHGSAEEVVQRLCRPADARYMRRVVEAELAYSLGGAQCASISYHLLHSSHDAALQPGEAETSLSRSSSHDTHSPHPAASHGLLQRSYFELPDDFSKRENGTATYKSVGELLRGLCVGFLLTEKSSCLRLLLTRLALAPALQKLLHAETDAALFQQFMTGGGGGDGGSNGGGRISGEVAVLLLRLLVTARVFGGEDEEPGGESNGKGREDSER